MMWSWMRWWKRLLITIDSNSVVKFRGRVCVPNDNALKEVHCSKFSIHPRVTTMYQDLKRTYWWIDIKRDVVDFVSKCQPCQLIKAHYQPPGDYWNHLKYQPGNESVSHTILSQNSQNRKRKHDSIWVVVDWFTKFTHFIPTRSTWMMKYLARMYIDNVVKLHGIPKEIVSNQDPLSSPHTS